MDRDQPLDSLVKCQHLGMKTVEMFHMHELVVVDLHHLSEEDLEKSAMQDHWDYPLPLLGRAITLRISSSPMLGMSQKQSPILGCDSRVE